MLKKQIVKYIQAFAPAVSWAALIFLLSHQQVLPGFTLSTADFILKKAGHIFVYAVLYLFVIEGFKKIGFKFGQIWLKALIICFLYAISDELHQTTVAGRTGALRDVGFDMVGVGLVVLRKFDYI